MGAPPSSLPSSIPGRPNAWVRHHVPFPRPSLGAPTHGYPNLAHPRVGFLIPLSQKTSILVDKNPGSFLTTLFRSERLSGRSCLPFHSRSVSQGVPLSSLTLGASLTAFLFPPSLSKRLSGRCFLSSLSLVRSVSQEPPSSPTLLNPRPPSPTHPRPIIHPPRILPQVATTFRHHSPSW